MPILAKTGLFSVCEIGNITRAIANHSDKENVGLPLDEVLKDADVLQHVLQNTTLPIRDKYEKRFEKLKKSFHSEQGIKLKRGIDFEKRKERKEREEGRSE